jgi:cobyrinic acid a,c-diamide synthase
MGENGIIEVFYKRLDPNAITLVEGNRGLFDGVDIHGTYSTARIAKLLDIPVLLIVDCTKATNSVTPLVIGCQAFDPEIKLAGVILNRVAGKRHGELIKKSIEHYTKLPVLGMIPNLDLSMPERHLGLTTVHELDDFNDKLEELGNNAEQYLNIEQIVDIARNASAIHSEKSTIQKSQIEKDKVLIGIIRDPAFQFYYSENLEALKQEGAEIVEFNSLIDSEIIPVDLLYIAGGFPEVHAEQISRNIGFMSSIKRYAEQGMPVYGECGAVIYLGKSLRYKSNSFKMCGIFDLDFEFSEKPRGHGYTSLSVDNVNPFFKMGLKLKGHEFHYSIPENWVSENYSTAFSIKKGFGFDGKRDGLNWKNVFVTYTHLHTTGADCWAKSLIDLARRKGFSKKLTP